MGVPPHSKFFGGAAEDSIEAQYANELGRGVAEKARTYSVPNEGALQAFVEGDEWMTFDQDNLIEEKKDERDAGTDAGGREEAQDEDKTDIEDPETEEESGLRAAKEQLLEGAVGEDQEVDMRVEYATPCRSSPPEVHQSESRRK